MFRTDISNRRLLLAMLFISAALPSLYADRRPGNPLRPGFNLLSLQHDLQFGPEAAKQVLDKSQPVNNPFFQAGLPGMIRTLKFVQ